MPYSQRNLNEKRIGKITEIFRASEYFMFSKTKDKVF